MKTDHKGKRNYYAKKAVELATEATQRNVEAENELRCCQQDNEKLKESNHTQCREIRDLEADKEELCSILRHALEDMQRDGVTVRNALHDRIKRHASSVLEEYRNGSEAAVSTAPPLQGAPRDPQLVITGTPGCDGSNFSVTSSTSEAPTVRRIYA